ncbi:DnaJ domain-containing protein [Halorientalis brevis]|uniref:DnaJ domain-containing protein n=1 Tax=Halorientalis brevis TaxID=1126241 RepID=A0ABD6CDU2_9EURY|nr:DnaJ domain-containing protein [Halorientalis brevis]
MSETYYEVLGVDDDATTEEIESAYRAKVKETHPDVSDAPDAEARFKRITRAKEVLTDPDLRARYDRLGHEQFVSAADNVVDGSKHAGGETGDEPAQAGPSSSEPTAGDGTADDRSGRREQGPSGSESDSESTDGAHESTGRTGSNPGTAEWQRTTTGSGRQRESSGYATRTTYTDHSVDRVRLPLTPQTIIQIGALFALYPVFLLASFFPAFPVAVNVTVGLCTLFVVAYLLSIPEVAIVVFGAWSLLAPLLFLSLFELPLVSIWGVLALLVTWFPFGLALLTRHALRR